MLKQQEEEKKEKKWLEVLNKVKEEEEMRKKALDVKIKKHDELITKTLEKKEHEWWLKIEQEAII